MTIAQIYTFWCELSDPGHKTFKGGGNAVASYESKKKHRDQWIEQHLQVTQ